MRKMSKACFHRAQKADGVDQKYWETNASIRLAEKPKGMVGSRYMGSGCVLSVLIGQRTDTAFVNRPMCVVLSF